MFDDFADFITKCPTPFHFAAYARQKFLDAGFTELKETEVYSEIPKKGFSIRNERLVLAWKDGGHDCSCIACSHCDSPCFILKPNFDEVVGGYRRARSSTYGGGLWYTWLDRDLRLAGRVIHRTHEGLKSTLYDSKVGIATIPCLAIHLDYSFCYSPKDLSAEDNLIPIYGKESDPPLKEFIASQLSIKSEDIVTLDLRFIDAEQPNQVNDILTSQRLDNMQNTYIIFKSFLDSEPQDGHLNMLGVFDNEETGSSTRCGAMSSAIDDTLQRILNDTDIRAFKAKSLVLSFDSNHATNPNFPNINEVNHKIYLGKGISLERDPEYDCSGDMKNEYAIREAAKSLGLNVQTNTVLNSGSGGSTIGPMTETRSGILTCDAGAPVLGMHSIRENGTVADIESGYKIVCELYNHYKKYQFPL